MKFKLDENLGSLGKSLLVDEGHDVATAFEQSLSGTSDENIYHVCRKEKRVLVTLDLDFAEGLRFPPEATAGIAVLRSPGRLSPRAIVARMQELASVLRTEPIDGKLWIVEPGRVRIHQSKRLEL